MKNIISITIFISCSLILSNRCYAQDIIKSDKNSEAQKLIEDRKLEEIKFRNRRIDRKIKALKEIKVNPELSSSFLEKNRKRIQRKFPEELIIKEISSYYLPSEYCGVNTYNIYFFSKFSFESNEELLRFKEAYKPFWHDTASLELIYIHKSNEELKDDIKVLPVKSKSFNDYDTYYGKEFGRLIFLCESDVIVPTGKGPGVYITQRNSENLSELPPSSESNYIDGKRNGLSRVWHENGRLKSESNYIDGKLNGLSSFWDEDGRLKSESNYIDGKRNGLTKNWYRHGQLRNEMNYSVPNFWENNKNLVPKLNGLCRVWYPDGQMWSERLYKNGKKEGISRVWYRDGQLHSEKNYENDNPEHSFYLAHNGVTVKASRHSDSAKVGTSSLFQGMRYTLVDDSLYRYIIASPYTEEIENIDLALDSASIAYQLAKAYEAEKYPNRKWVDFIIEANTYFANKKQRENPLLSILRLNVNFEDNSYKAGDMIIGGCRDIDTTIIKDYLVQFENSRFLTTGTKSSLEGLVTEAYPTTYVTYGNRDFTTGTKSSLEGLTTEKNTKWLKNESSDGYSSLVVFNSQVPDFIGFENELLKQKDSLLILKSKFVDQYINDSCQIVTSFLSNMSINHWGYYDTPGGITNNPNFNKNIDSWDVSNVTNMDGMFYGAASFNQDISNWDVSNVIGMRDMFDGASSFNQDISNWDVSNVTDMTSMFDSATSFNQDISSWDVKKVRKMTSMFYGAASFNQDISNWNIEIDSVWYGNFAINSPLTLRRQPDFYSSSRFANIEGFEHIINFYQSLKNLESLDNKALNKLRALSEKRVNVLYNSGYYYGVTLKKLDNIEYDNSGNKIFTVTAAYYFSEYGTYYNREVVVLDSDNNISDWRDIKVLKFKDAGYGDGLGMSYDETDNLSFGEFYRVLGSNKEYDLNEAYNEIIALASKFDNYAKGVSQIGGARGTSSFSFNQNRTIKVGYTALGNSAIEIGKVEDLAFSYTCGFKNCEDYYKVSLQGKWKNLGPYGDGYLYVTLNRKSNLLVVHIFGEGSSGWHYWTDFDLQNQSNMDKALKIFYGIKNP